MSQRDTMKKADSEIKEGRAMRARTWSGRSTIWTMVQLKTKRRGSLDGALGEGKVHGGGDRLRRVDSLEAVVAATALMFGERTTKLWAGHSTPKDSTRCDSSPPCAVRALRAFVRIAVGAGAPDVGRMVAILPPTSRYATAPQIVPGGEEAEIELAVRRPCARAGVPEGCGGGMRRSAAPSARPTSPPHRSSSRRGDEGATRCRVSRSSAGHDVVDAQPVELPTSRY